MKKLQESDYKDWILALRSGNYEQGGRRLRGLDNTYCCLGVLADRQGCSWELTSLGNYGAFFDPQQGYYIMNVPTEFLDHDVQGTLMSMNDVDKASFHDIADYVEENYKDWMHA